MEKNRKIDKIPRRKFLNWIIPVFGASAIGFSFKSIYSGSINSYISKLNPKRVLKSSKSKRRYKNKKIWNKELIIVNTKTNIVHYPSSGLFTYYNQIADKHISVIAFNEWKSKVVQPKHFIKTKSGIIFEKLILTELSLPLSNDKLQKATDTLSLAFSEQYNNRAKFQINSYNWRLYDLLLQFIALNTSIPFELKWGKFSDIIKLVDFKSVKVPKRNTWVKSKNDFEFRVKYIVSNKDSYMKRIEKRIG